MGKGEIARNEQFLLFPQCFLPIWRTFCHFNYIWNCLLQTLWIWKSLKFVIWERVKQIPDQTFSLVIFFFQTTKIESICRLTIKFTYYELKTFLKKEKMLVTGIFSISYHVFERLLHRGLLNSELCCKDLTRYQTTNSRLPNWKSLPTTISKFDKNGRKLSKQVENTVGKGEIARYEQFLLFPQCFQKACFPGASKGVIVQSEILLWNYFYRIDYNVHVPKPLSENWRTL